MDSIVYKPKTGPTLLMGCGVVPDDLAYYASNGSYSVEEGIGSVVFGTTASTVADVYVSFPVDLTGYSTLKAYFSHRYGSYNIIETLAISVAGAQNVRTSYTTINNTDTGSVNTGNLLTLDVSEYSGTYYVAVGINTGGSSWSNARDRIVCAAVTAE